MCARAWVINILSTLETRMASVLFGDTQNIATPPPLCECISFCVKWRNQKYAYTCLYTNICTHLSYICIYARYLHRYICIYAKIDGLIYLLCQQILLGFPAQSWVDGDEALQASERATKASLPISGKSIFWLYIYIYASAYVCMCVWYC